MECSGWTGLNGALVIGTSADHTGHYWDAFKKNTACTTTTTQAPSSLVEARRSWGGIGWGCMKDWSGHSKDITSAALFPQLLDGLKTETDLGRSWVDGQNDESSTDAHISVKICDSLIAVKMGSLGVHSGRFRFTWGSDVRYAYTFAYSTDGLSWDGYADQSVTVCSNSDPNSVAAPGAPIDTNTEFWVQAPSQQFLWFGVSAPCWNQQIREIEYSSS